VRWEAITAPIWRSIARWYRSWSPKQPDLTSQGIRGALAAEHGIAAGRGRRCATRGLRTATPNVTSTFLQNLTHTTRARGYGRPSAGPAIAIKLGNAVTSSKTPAMQSDQRAF
jgi:hypothetical protein